MRVIEDAIKKTHKYIFKSGQIVNLVSGQIKYIHKKLKLVVKSNTFISSNKTKQNEKSDFS